MTAPMPSQSLTGVALASVRFLTQLRENSKLREQYGLVPDIGRDHSGAIGGGRPFAFTMTTSTHWDCAAMDWPDYLRDQAAMYRKLAEQADDPVVKNEMLELASVCEEVASNIEDHLTGG